MFESYNKIYSKNGISIILLLIFFVLLYMPAMSQCNDTCGNGIADAGETNLNCPQDIPHTSTCISPCNQPTSYESSVGIRQAFDFTGTTTYSTVGLPSGWSFAGAPTPTTAGALPATDTYGAKAGLIQPNCSGSCVATNGFCIGNLASTVAVGAGGTSGKLGANFDGRANVSVNSSYAVLRGQSNPTLVSPTFDFSSVEGFKIQFWLFPSETSCGQTNAWGSCVGNVAYLDFSANDGTTWTQILTLNLSSSSSDMCFNNSTNTLWLNASAWTRVCLTVFNSSTSAGNFYTAASATSAASGIMVNSAYFTSTFKFRVRYAQTASCTAGITTTNPGRYLAIDYPVITSGNQMIPCGISFTNMCGYGADNNDDGVGSSTLTTTTIAYGTVRRGVNHAERGVEILTSQNSTFASQNITGSAFATNFDLCNAEGGDKQCIDWQSNNNFYTAVYECITDWEAVSGTGINVQYYEGTTPQSLGMTKVTTAGRTALIGWRYSGNRIVSCGSFTDLNPGCNGYSFVSGSLPTQFARGFYNLSVNSTGQSWAFYGATSCSNYFNGPFFAPISIADTLSNAPNYLTCNTDGDLVFTGLVKYCSDNSGFTGSSSLSITGPNGFSEVIISGDTGIVAIVDTGEYIIIPFIPTQPASCIDCARKTCISISTADLGVCLSLPVELKNFNVSCHSSNRIIRWQTTSETNNAYYEVERSTNAIDFNLLQRVYPVSTHSNQLQTYQLTDLDYNDIVYYRLKQVDTDGSIHYSKIVYSSCKEVNENSITTLLQDGNLIIKNNNNSIINCNLEIIDITGSIMLSKIIHFTEPIASQNFYLGNLPTGIYYMHLWNQEDGGFYRKKMLIQQ
jgi:hypothetical protein